MNLALLFNIVTSFLLTYLVIPPTVRISNAKNLMDVPDKRKLNKQVVPTLGGIAIFVGLNLSTMLFIPRAGATEIRFLYASVIMMFFIGLKDDILIISARKKFIVQLMAALVLVLMGNYRITNLYGLAGINELADWFSIPLSILIVLFLVNAMNLIDGIDGLASGVSIVITSFLGVWFYMSGFTTYGIICTALAGSLLAFLRFNLWGGKNKVFMGDTGSLVLGIVLSAVIIKFIELNYYASYPFYLNQAPLVALALLIVPITDTLRVFSIRLYHKKSPFSPDMNHIHHILIKSGLSHIQASSFLIAYTVFFTILALTLEIYLNITVGFIVILTSSFIAIGFLYYRMKRIQNITSNEEDNSSIKIISLFPSKENPMYDRISSKK